MSSKEETELSLLIAAAAAAATVVTVTIIKKFRRKKRSVLVRPLFQRGHDRGAYNILMAELRSVERDYVGFTRLTLGDFDFLLSSGGARPGRARSNDLAERLPPWLSFFCYKKYMRIEGEQRTKIDFDMRNSGTAYMQA